MQRSSLPSTFGMSGITPWGNIGKVDNSGVDISIDYNKAFSKDLILSLRGTFTYAHNEIVSKWTNPNTNGATNTRPDTRSTRSTV